MNLSTPFVIETHALSKTYKNIQALRSLDLKVRQNSIFGFLGPNGAGKTTTIKLMLGLIRSSAGSATVLVMILTDRMWKKLPSDHPAVYQMPALDS